MSANDTQVGGDHYKTDGGLQHWDMVSLFNLDYFQGQITKYILRWKYKHSTPAKRLEDLKKARHFLDKYIELQEKKIVQPAPMPSIDHSTHPWWGKTSDDSEPGPGYVNQG